MMRNQLNKLCVLISGALTLGYVEFLYSALSRFYVQWQNYEEKIVQ